MSDLVTVHTAARRLSVSNKRIYQLIQSGRLDSLRLSPRALRITRESVERFIAEGVKKEKAELGLDLGPLPKHAPRAHQ
jgi:excisionase family DNA binding protein